MEPKETRKNELYQWVEMACQLKPHRIEPMPGDASFRRYFRIHTEQGSSIAMDAPPAQENCASFVAIAKTLRNMGLSTPDILAADLEQGFLLLTDFGDQTLLKVLNPQNADQLYARALDALAELQKCREVTGKDIPPFSRKLLLQEWAWHKEWFLNAWLGLTLKPEEEKQLDFCYMHLVELALKQPQVFMHRDYHSANLMVLPDTVGILDFQDAFIGPVTYDLASLLRDCYIDWPEQQVSDWALSYKQRLNLPLSNADFIRCFDWMGVQRHLKALFTFARKQVRDRQPSYLAHIPRTLNYVLNVTDRYPALAPMHNYYQKQVLPLCVR